jgi:DNA repair exonuclease SbcCD nuclease subunit
MLHTTINEAAVSPIMPSIDKMQLPLANYYALGHIHQNMHLEEGRQHSVYPGPTFPNNFQELVDLKSGSFQITEITDKIKTRSIQIPIKEVVYIEKEITNGLTATEEVIHELDRHNLSDKILLLKLKGVLTAGKSGDIKFGDIESFVAKKQAYCFLRNISSLKLKESDVGVATGIEDMANIEGVVIDDFNEKYPSDFNVHTQPLMNIFSIEKKEDEKIQIFEERLIDELKTELNLEGKL